MKFRLIRQPEIAYITEESRAYGQSRPPRMSWEAPRGRLFSAGWELIDMGLEPQSIAELIRSHLRHIG